MEEYIVFLKDTHGNKAGDFAVIEEKRGDAIYYNDSRDVRCVVEAAEEGDVFMFAEKGTIKGANILTSDIPEFVQYEHHGLTWVCADLVGEHREFCLCYSCEKFKPDTDENCKIAAGLFAFDIRNKVTTPVWECGEFEKKASLEDIYLQVPQDEWERLTRGEWTDELMVTSG